MIGGFGYLSKSERELKTELTKIKTKKQISTTLKKLDNIRNKLIERIKIFSPQLAKRLQLDAIILHLKLALSTPSQGLQIIRQHKLLIQFIIALDNNPNLLTIPKAIVKILPPKYLALIKKFIQLKIQLKVQKDIQQKKDIERSRILSNLTITSVDTNLVPDLLQMVNSNIERQRQCMQEVKKSWTELEVQRKLDRYTFEINEVRQLAKNLWQN